MHKHGYFVISLDFELLWGVRDKRTIESYGDHIRGVWQALPRMLELFDAYGVKATFATVGFLFASEKAELLRHVPKPAPAYTNRNLSPYNGHFELVKESEAEDPYHFASALIGMIQQYPGQEVASHTFSHYYCLEQGQGLDDFRRDLAAAREIALGRGVELRSLVFPRNQFNEAYLQACREYGITSFRGNEQVWFHKAQNREDETLLKRAFRLLDTYINISGHHSYPLEQAVQDHPYNFPSSRFLRPYSHKLRALEPLRLRRILRSMSHAARRHEVYHLWWHPHNFGVNQEQNFAFLEAILSHYQKLQVAHGFASATMGELAAYLDQEERHG